MDVRADYPLDNLNTLRLPARAQWYAEPASTEALVALLREPRWRGVPRTVLGGGSNLVLAGDISGLVIRPMMRGLRELPGGLLEVQAGEEWDSVVARSIEAGWQGLENLSLIPGSAGAAPVQNIGAYGVELCHHLAGLEAVSLQNGQIHHFTAEQCDFGYRESRFKSAEPGQWLITRLQLRLNRAPVLQLGYADLSERFAALPESGRNAAGLRQVICQLRREKLPDPAALPNAGSFFKNPVVEAAHWAALRERFPAIVGYPQADGRVKLAAGWLIEQAGWKGRRHGPLGMHERQALVLVNHGGASGATVLAFAEAVRESVQTMFQVQLEQEPVTLGSPGQALQARRSSPAGPPGAPGGDIITNA
ncbi:UDP-N-acetylmuramate dehydrogenase [Alcanivorax quisquiliarum]|uniref:UDP-N-acetylenolpyruvoylglucosamine reductase n=1 Tax=Alcanivorax quisquiliarum TaxID=2933565 RepID=A0ABT0E3U3_9GAMM|nr:UDP-N-acetylmuramate dehydrogenase [Alcanivorax quisquiliarum]MCK0536480.1 UDP-N-acetylmuramate dehydrogenase [Alcanivorax quisquiliarum]